MEVRTLADERILDILEKDSQRGMALLMEKYTALIWHVSSHYIRNPEDIKECVNDTFSEFYFHRKRFKSEKSSLAAYLTAIARNKAVSLYRKEQREKKRRADVDSEKLAEKESQIEQAELRTDIERAMSLLKPNELQIIRMKYYDGMSVREIAASLNLPYETVKKRHQRSVLKLGQSLMLILALVFILTACVYGVLRYLEVIPPIGAWSWPWIWEKTDEPKEEQEDDIREKEVPELHLGDTGGEQREPDMDADLPEQEGAEEALLSISPTALPMEEEGKAVDMTPTVMDEYTVSPGYGVNVDPKEPVYTLAEKETVENERYGLTLEEAHYINHRVTATIRLYKKNDTVESWKELSEGINVKFISFKEFKWNRTYISCRSIDSSTELLVCCFDNVSLPDLEKGIENISILFTSGDSISFSMSRVEQEKVTEYPHQTGELGGILAIPRFEEGSLIIAIHPLDDEDEFQIVPAIIVDSAGSGSERILMITGEDGTTYAGECIRYHPMGEETYFEWNFGKVRPGSYKLNIPWIYMQAKMNEINMPIDPLKNLWDDKKYSFPGGRVWIQDCIPLDAKPEEELSMIKKWRIRIGYDSVYENCPVTGFYGLSCEMDCDPSENDRFETGYVMRMISNDAENGIWEYDLTANLELSNPQSMHLFFSKTDTVNLRWNQSFEIPFTVE
ncbi:sigma-70 family RNA polymerase sigma factor [Lachnospiraceae bacterium WCA-9-b2]|uniref:Sigma-70 family RNA polymerase sigma factor n=1 Tax=Sporofaciens musculi TaxID=2681861 RepID=A0A7X3MD46_9FIRM|nr:sigma-70 family RNA polymerase sigma factor [Sporofaciens musculi]MXP74239.1 sigma-70 family RNA polymerase sigma factor [Sporofaciens musculi]